MSRCVAVTGSASGIGRAVADLLVQQGDTVIGVDRADAAVCADLSLAAGRRAAAAEVRQRCGGVLDAVVACAGLANPDPATVAVNYFGVVEFVEELHPVLVAAEAPRVGVVASISGTQPFDTGVLDACLDGDEDTALRCAADVIARGDWQQVYPSSKAAVTRWLRRTAVAPGWADAGISLNAVAPGVVRTPMSESMLRDDSMRAAAEKAVPMPLHGLAAAADVARPLCWLVSAQATHITGQVLYVDGGAEATLRGPQAF